MSLSIGWKSRINIHWINWEDAGQLLWMGDSLLQHDGVKGPFSKRLQIGLRAAFETSAQPFTVSNSENDKREQNILCEIQISGQSAERRVLELEGWHV